jgi:hypothetical protein
MILALAASAIETSEEVTSHLLHQSLPTFSSILCSCFIENNSDLISIIWNAIHPYYLLV